MALNPNVFYNPSQITAPDANYPYGSLKDSTAVGLFDGTPITKPSGDDIWGMQQALLNFAGIVPSNTSDTVLVSEYCQSLVEIAQGRASLVVEDGGSAADAYVVTHVATSQKARSYFDNQTLFFRTAFPSSGASVTLDAFGLGVKSVTLEDGSNPSAGDISTTSLNKVIFDDVLDRFHLQKNQAPLYKSGFAVNFDGTGVPSINYALNVSSITDIGQGDYIANITTPLPSDNYYATGIVRSNAPTGNAYIAQGSGSVKTASQFGFRTTGEGGNPLDYSEITVFGFHV